MTAHIKLLTFASVYCCLCVLLFLSCSRDNDPVENENTTVSSIEVSVPLQSNLILGVDVNTIFTAVAKNSEGKVLQNINFQWSSTNQSVASINQNGVLSIEAAGTVTIIATAQGITGSIDITIESIADLQVSITSTDTNFMLGTLNEPRFQVQVIVNNERNINNPDVTWSSLDVSVVGIDQNGVITVNSIGTTEITVSFLDVTDAIAVSVTPPTGEGNFEFKSDGIALRATVNLPSGTGPFPSVVLVHGSGTASRSSSFQGFADILTNNGIAVFFYDKRGVGQSEGSFMEVGVTPEGIDRVTQLGRDALAAHNFFQLHEQTNSVGLFGWSQAGWVNPIAVSEDNGSIDFMVNIVGPACTVGEEIFYSSLVDGGTSIEEANDAVSNFTGVHGYDPIPDLQQTTIPSLWVLGGQDASIPTQVTLDRLNILIGNGKPFEIQYYANGTHALQDADTGQQIAYLSGNGGAIDWVLKTAGN